MKRNKKVQKRKEKNGAIKAFVFFGGDARSGSLCQGINVSRGEKGVTLDEKNRSIADADLGSLLTLAGLGLHHDDRGKECVGRRFGDGFAF